MRVEIYDSRMCSHTIDSKNARLIGEWFAEHAALLMTADARDMVQIRIWPDDEDDFRVVRAAGLSLRFTQDDLLALAQSVLDAAEKVGELEKAAR